MMSKTTIQLLLLIISSVIIMSYIKPTFESMQATQDETQEYRQALDNAAKFNQELARLVAAEQNMSTSERRAMERYLPNKIDPIGVMRDIQTIADNNEMSLIHVGTAQEEAAPFFVPAQGQDPLEESQLVATAFTVNVIGEYNSFKRFLQDLERNAYPLEITSLKFNSATQELGPLYSYQLVIETYAFDITSNSDSD